MNKKAFLDMEVVNSPMFLLLAFGSLIAVLGGYAMSKKMGLETFGILQLVVTLVGCIAASYFFAWKMEN